MCLSLQYALVFTYSSQRSPAGETLRGETNEKYGDWKAALLDSTLRALERFKSALHSQVTVATSLTVWSNLSDSAKNTCYEDNGVVQTCCDLQGSVETSNIVTRWPQCRAAGAKLDSVSVRCTPQGPRNHRTPAARTSGSKFENYHDCNEAVLVPVFTYNSIS